MLLWLGCQLFSSPLAQMALINGFVKKRSPIIIIINIGVTCRSEYKCEIEYN